MTRSRPVLGALIFLVMACLSLCARAADLRVDLPGHGALVFAVPLGWTSQILRSGPQLPPLVRLAPAVGNEFQMLITTLPTNAHAARPTARIIRENVGRAAAKAASRSVQRDLPLIDISSPAAFGTYFSATDRDPEPHGFKHLTQGTLLVADVLIGFTVLANGEPDAVVGPALQMLKTVRHQQ